MLLLLLLMVIINFAVVNIIISADLIQQVVHSRIPLNPMHSASF